ncbi:MAG: tRNA (adenosine(37)-N6)-threonylcarbamoyltransferase complex transferase subunit TsaD [bacterium]
MSPLVLGIETSCDETAVALARNGEVLASRVASQEIHARWGGVVPEIASRLHQRTLSKMVREILADEGFTLQDINTVGATRGPGLIGALLVGTSYAKGLATGLGVPFIGVNHLEGHLWSAAASGEEMPLPALALLVSGGHTELFRIDGFRKYTFLGATLDDAVGEAFDKVGVLLGIPYPAGAEVSRLAEKGNPQTFPFRVAQTDSPFDFSFSGLKSAVMREVKRLEREKTDPESWSADLAASFQESAVLQLSVRVNRALENDQYRSILLGGGVAANRRLRERLSGVADRHNVRLVVPPVTYCTDNAAMIAWVAERALREQGGDSLTLEADPNLTISAES